MNQNFYSDACVPINVREVTKSKVSSTEKKIRTYSAKKKNHLLCCTRCSTGAPRVPVS